MENKNNSKNNVDNEDSDIGTSSSDIARSIIRLALNDTVEAQDSSAQKPSENPKCLNLPGAVSPVQIAKFSNLSKSDQNLKNIKIDAEFVKSLKLTSVSFQQKHFNETQEASKVTPSTSHDTAENIVNDIPKNITSYLNDQIKNAIMEIITTNATNNEDVIIDSTTNNIAIVNPVAIDFFPITRTIENEIPITNTKLIAKVHKPVVTSIRSIQKTLNLEPKRVDSLSSIGSNVCRICMTRGKERLVSPCICKGSIASVHLSCLERWLNQMGRNQCELCRFSYPTIRTPRYTVVQGLRMWFRNPLNRSHFQSDCMIFWLLSIVTAALLAVCVIGIQHFIVEGKKFHSVYVGVLHKLTQSAMNLFMAFVLVGYSATVYQLWKDQYSTWNRWRQTNVNVRLLLSPDSAPVPFVPRPPLHV